MDEKKQIEEIFIDVVKAYGYARDYCCDSGSCDICENKKYGKNCDFFSMAKSLYDQGCRKLPCRIGDTVWAIQCQFGTRKIIPGKVSEMFYVGEEMKLCIVVRRIVRGTWGENVFPTREAALEVFEKGGCL